MLMIMRLSIFRIIFFFLIIVFGYLQYVLWFEKDGILDMMRLKRELAVQVQSNEKLKQHNNELYQQVERLKRNPEVTEGRARQELGMIKKGETFYQVVK